MEALIELLVQFLPHQIEYLKYLKLLPDAVATVKEVTALVQRSIKTLQGPNVPMTDEQRAILLASIDAMSSDEYHTDPALDQR